MRRRANQIFSLENFTQMMIFSVGIVVALAVGLPQFYPQLTRGGNCANLPHPPGGNQRSLLQYNDDDQNLEIEVVIDDTEVIGGEYQLPAGEPFTVQVVFRNSDTSPLYLYFLEGLPDNQRVLGSEAQLNQSGPGLYLIFFAENVTITREGQPALQTPQQVRSLDNLYVMQAGTTCNVRLELETTDIPGFSLGASFRLVAIYQNNDPGVFPTPNLTPTATPIPDLTSTQGIWAEGRVFSDPIRVTFQQQ